VGADHWFDPGLFVLMYAPPVTGSMYSPLADNRGRGLGSFGVFIISPY